MPVRDGAAFLEEALESLRQQTLREVEFVVVDDGSRDDTPRLLERMARNEPRLRVITKPSLGLMAALITGCTSARAPLLARMDADDIALPERLERQVMFLDAHPEIGVVGCRMEVVDTAGQKTGEFDVPLTPAECAWGLLFEAPLAHPTVVMRREVYEACGGYDPAAHIVEDYELWTRLFEHTRFANLPGRLLRYRRHGATVTELRRQEQREAFERVRLQLVERMLGRSVAPALLDLALRSPTRRPLARPRTEVQAALGLLTALHTAWASRGLLAGEGAEAVAADVQARRAAAQRHLLPLRPLHTLRWRWQRLTRRLG